MGFYEEIAPYYEEIFPAGEEQLKFIMETAGDPPSRLLDVACGAGLYSVKLAQKGYEVWACDADLEMIRQARQKAASLNGQVTFFISDMQELALPEEKGPNRREAAGFHCVFCIGNSIVHLNSTAAVGTAVKSMKKLLLPGGSLLLQIINFDRVLQQGVTSLPTLRNDKRGLTFTRKYDMDKTTGLIHFDTVLTLDRDGVPLEFNNRVDLFPLTSDMLNNILRDAGFKTVKFYSDFNKNEFDLRESFMLVAAATVPV